MKKVTLELTARQLNTLVYTFTFMNQFYAKSREQRVLHSILSKTSLKIRKKHLEADTAPTLFQKAKKYKFSFEYHEGDCLEKYLLLVEQNPLNEYDQNAILFIKNKLNQQLA